MSKSYTRKSRASGSTKALIERIIRLGRYPSRRRQHSKKGVM